MSVCLSVCLSAPQMDMGILGRSKSTHLKIVCSDVMVDDLRLAYRREPRSVSCTRIGWTYGWANGWTNRWTGRQTD
jgi:hypothetical protein